MVNTDDTRRTTDDGRRTTDDGRRTTPRVWHKLPTGELKNKFLSTVPLKNFFTDIQDGLQSGACCMKAWQGCIGSFSVA